MRFGIFCTGNPVHLHLIDNKRKYRKVFIGNNFEENQVPQVVVPSGCWFAANVESDFALVGCTVSPGFDFHDFELAEREMLINQFPEHIEIITR